MRKARNREVLCGLDGTTSICMGLLHTKKEKYSVERIITVSKKSLLSTSHSSMDGGRERVQLRQGIQEEVRVTTPESKDVVNLPQLIKLKDG